MLIGHLVRKVYLLLAQVNQVFVRGVGGQASNVEVGSGQSVSLSTSWVGETRWWRPTTIESWREAAKTWKNSRRTGIAGPGANPLRANTTQSHTRLTRALVDQRLAHHTQARTSWLPRGL